MKTGMIYKTQWNSGIFCTMGQDEFYPNVKIEIWKENIPFKEIDGLMERFTGTFEEAAKFLVEQIEKRFQTICRIRVEIGDEYFTAFAEKEEGI